MNIRLIAEEIGDMGPASVPLEPRDLEHHPGERTFVDEEEEPDDWEKLKNFIDEKIEWMARQGFKSNTADRRSGYEIAMDQVLKQMHELENQDHY